MPSAAVAEPGKELAHERADASVALTDNIHWAHDGRLIAVGHVGQDWRIVMIDPNTLAIEEIHRQGAIPAFGGGTAALEVGDELWVGSYRGDRIAVVPRRP